VFLLSSRSTKDYSLDTLRGLGLKTTWFFVLRFIDSMPE
jgi:hypothetical protein